MRNILFMHVQYCGQDLSHKLNCLLFCEDSGLLDEVEEVSSLAQLHYEYELVIPLKYLVHLY